MAPRSYFLFHDTVIVGRCVQQIIPQAGQRAARYGNRA